MKQTRAKSSRNCTITHKFPEIFPKINLIRTRFNSPNFQDISLPPTATDPPLTIRMKKLHGRPLQSPPKQCDEFSHQANETLSALLKNSAITFISPHDLINQLHSDSISPSPSDSLQVPRSKTSFSSKISHKRHGSTEFNHIESASQNRSLIGKIEVTGFQIPKLMSKNRIEDEPEQKLPEYDSGFMLNLTKEIKIKSLIKPVIIVKRENKYFKSRRRNEILKSANLSYYFPCKL